MMSIDQIRINFVGRKKLWYVISLIFIIPGLISLLFQGLNLGIDFTGGNLLEIRFEENVTTEQVREVFQARVDSSYSVQDSGNNSYLVQTDVLTEEQNNAILGDLTTKLGKNEILRNEHVGPVVGRELSLNAFYALIIASVLMVIYITVRFEFKFAIAAILALLHDILVLVGIFSIFQIEVDSTFVAVILTIIGYSINDTIIIFDRIRENLTKAQKKSDLGDLVNQSITQTLSRSLNTVFCVVLMLIALLVLGGETTKVFSLALLIGISAGCYSSIFVASPLWFDFTHWAAAKKEVRA